MRNVVIADDGSSAWTGRMGTLRFLGLAAFMFAAAFMGMNWLLRVEPLKPDARLPTFQRVDTASPSYQFQQSSITDDDATRDRLRMELLDYAQSLAGDPCNETLRKHYIEAANNYARAWISIVPCIRSQTCSQSDSKRLDLAANAFGTPMDHRVREAMRALHAKHIFKLGDFPNDTAFFVAELAADGTINPRVQRAKVFGPASAENGARARPSFEDIEAQIDDDPQPPQHVCGG
jgi:hypothetical protein